MGPPQIGIVLLDKVYHKMNLSAAVRKKNHPKVFKLLGGFVFGIVLLDRGNERLVVNRAGDLLTDIEDMVADTLKVGKHL